MNETKQPAVAGPVELTVRQHTAGPWDWYMSDRGEAMLATPDRGRLYVMQPVRCGMQGGTVRFSEWGEGPRGRRGGVMRDAKEHLRNGVLMHPDALLIAAAPDLLDVVQALVLAQQQGCDPALMVAEDSPLMDAARDALQKACGIRAA